MQNDKLCAIIIRAKKVVQIVKVESLVLTTVTSVASL